MKIDGQFRSRVLSGEFLAGSWLNLGSADHRRDGRPVRVRLGRARPRARAGQRRDDHRAAAGGGGHAGGRPGAHRRQRSGALQARPRRRRARRDGALCQHAGRSGSSGRGDAVSTARHARRRQADAVDRLRADLRRLFRPRARVAGHHDPDRNRRGGRPRRRDCARSTASTCCSSGRWTSRPVSASPGQYEHPQALEAFRHVATGRAPRGRRRASCCRTPRT